MKIMEAKARLEEQEINILVVDEKLSKSAKVKVLFEHGFEVKEIAQILNIRYNFAYNVIQNYVIVNDIQVQTEKRETKKDSVFALFDQGKTLTEVAKELKMNYNYVWKLQQEWKQEAEAAAAAAEEVK